jgi:hypothetical protein
VGSFAPINPPERIMHLSLAQVLPDGVVFALHRTLGFAAILTCDEHSPQMRAAQFLLLLR